MNKNNLKDTELLHGKLGLVLALQATLEKTTLNTDDDIYHNRAAFESFLQLLGTERRRDFLNEVEPLIRAHATNELLALKTECQGLALNIHDQLLNDPVPVATAAPGGGC